MKLFVIVSRVPYPLDKGDKLRIYHQLKELSQNHKIMLCCLDDNNTKQEHIEHLKAFCDDVKVFKLNRVKIYLNLFRALFSSKPYQVHYFYQRTVHRKISQFIQSYRPDRIYCQLIRTAEYVKNEHHIVKTIDYMDAFSKGIDRRTPNSGLLKPLFKDEAKRLLKYEHLIFDYFDQHSIISAKERQLIYHQKRESITVVTNGIDTSYFKPFTSKTDCDIIFVGNMSYAPNVSAVQYIVNDILPLLDKSIKVKIAGANPSKEVKALANDRVVVSGWIEDIRDAYASAKVFVAPLFIGTGLQNKLLEAMAMELPCITTDLVNNSLGGIKNRDLEIANNAEEFARLITSLLDNESRRGELGENGRSFVKSTYSWQESTKRLEEILEKNEV